MFVYPELVEIVGSRWFAGDPKSPDPSLIQVVYDCVDTLADGTIVITGGAPGADSYVKAACDQFGVRCFIFDAKWDELGKRAGFVRNEEMANFIGAYSQIGPTRAFAFWDGASPGTEHSIDLLVERGVETHIIPPLV